MVAICCVTVLMLSKNALIYMEVNSFDDVTAKPVVFFQEVIKLFLSKKSGLVKFSCNSVDLFFYLTEEMWGGSGTVS